MQDMVGEAHLDAKLRALGGVPDVTGRDNVDAQPEDQPVDRNNYRKRSPLWGADRVLEVLDITQHGQRAACAVDLGSSTQSARRYFRRISD
jgi:hypothetical protein